MARGDHLKVQRLGYTHHGVEIDGGKVVHYSGLADRLAAGPVQVVSKARFACGRPVEVVRHRRRLPPDEVIERALSRLGEDRYNVLIRNCEHFATWAVTGEPRCAQVRRAAAAAGLVLVAAVGVVAAPKLTGRSAA